MPGGTGWPTHTSVDLYLGAPVEVEVRPHDVERPLVVVELRSADLTVLVVDVPGVSQLIEALVEARDELRRLLAGEHGMRVAYEAAAAAAIGAG